MNKRVSICIKAAFFYIFESQIYPVFCILGIGVDDMFILLSGLMQAGFGTDVKDRIGTMMRVSGVAITITSLTNILAFACGAISTFKSVRNFCVFTGKIC